MFFCGPQKINVSSVQDYLVEHSMCILSVPHPVLNSHMSFEVGAQGSFSETTRVRCH